MHVNFGPYHVSDIEFVAAFDVDAKKVGLDLSQAILASENNTIKICDVPQLDVPVLRGTTLDGLGKYYRETIEESLEEPVDVVKTLKDNAVDVLICYLPVGSENAAKFYAQCRHRRQGRVRQRAARLHRQHPGVGAEVHRRRCPDRRRRHQVPGRRHHHAPRADQVVRGPRRRGAAHLPAQRRRQHGLQEHARARPPRVEEDLQDPVGHLADPRPRPRRAQRAHRPVGLRRVARRPQVGLHPARGQDLRRRAAEPRVQARGLGLARTRPASSSTPCARRRSPWTAASAARSCRRRATS